MKQAIRFEDLDVVDELLKAEAVDVVNSMSFADAINLLERSGENALIYRSEMGGCVKLNGNGDLTFYDNEGVPYDALGALSLEDREANDWRFAVEAD